MTDLNLDEELHKECMIECDCMIGYDSNEEICRGKWKFANLDVIVKTRFNQKRTAPIPRNDRLLHELSPHPNIITLYKIACSSPLTPRYLQYIFPHSYIACLHNLLCHPQTSFNPEAESDIDQDQHYKITNEKCVQWAQDVAMGMDYLHSKEILHCNLMSACVWISNRNVAVLSDLSSACHVNKVNKVDVAGTARWRAPELMERNCIVTKESDVYSYGMVLYELNYRKLPFSDKTSIRADFEASKCKRPHLDQETPQYLTRLMEGCWNRKPQERPHFRDIILAFECKIFPLPLIFKEL